MQEAKLYTCSIYEDKETPLCTLVSIICPYNSTKPRKWNQILMWELSKHSTEASLVWWLAQRKFITWVLLSMKIYLDIWAHLLRSLECLLYRSKLSSPQKLLQVWLLWGAHLVSTEHHFFYEHGMFYTEFRL